jgi:hypothetical protein
VSISNGSLTITSAPLTVSADNHSRAYGATNPPLTGTIVGIQNSDNITATYVTTATVSSPVGSYGVVPALADPDTRLANYTVTTNNGTLTLTPASLTGTADNKSRLYGQVNPAFTVTYSGFVNGEGSSIVTGSLLGSTSADTNSPVGTYPISVSGQAAPNYNITYLDGVLTVTPVELLVQADNKSRAYGQTNPALTATTSGFVNGESANVLSGALVLSTVAETNSPIGTYPIIASGLTSTNYSIVYSNGTLTVTPFGLSVIADDKSRVYGAANPTLTGTLTGVQNGDNITAIYSTTASATNNVGTSSIIASLNDPNSKLTNYSVSISNGSLTITSAPLTVLADNQSRAYGATNPPLTGTIVGIQNGDNITATYVTTATVSSPVGSYGIVPSLADPDSRLANYTVTTNNGTFTVTPASLIGTADNKSRLYGQVDPAFTVAYTGFVNGENSSIVTGSLLGSTTANTNSPVGGYPISVSGQAAPNYNINYVDGMLTITPVELLVQAGNKSRAYGQTNPVLTATTTGFVNGENANVLGGALVLSTLADTNSPVGTYPILASGLTATNYSISYSNGTLTVTPFGLSVITDDKTRVYGAGNPTLTGTLTGVQNGDNITASYSTSATATNNVGAYGIVPSLNDPNNKLTNYSVSVSNGTLTITAAPLMAIADNHARAYGAANPLLTGTIVGIQNSDNITATYLTTATASSPVGNYSIVPSLVDPDGRLANYNLFTNNGTLTVAPSALTVAADNKARTYGAANPALTGTLTGVQNSDNITASYSTGASATNNVGAYSIVPSLNDPDSKLTNYSVTISNGTLAITKAPLAVTADNQSRTYGTTNPVFTGSIVGIQNSDNISTTYSTVATTSSPVGTYPIVPSLQDPDNRLGNYALSSTNGTLSVTSANSSLALSSSANPATVGTNVTFTVSVSAVGPASGTPTGNVQLLTNGLAYGSPVALTAGSAAISISTLPAGTNAIAVVYSGDGNFLSSSNAISQVITAPVSEQPSSLEITNNGNGTVTLTLHGAAGVQYVLQARDDMLSANWINISTNVAPTNGIWTHTESTAGRQQRLYRLAKLTETSGRPDQPLTLSITNNGNGTVTVKFRGTPGVQYIAQAADNLVSGLWINISTNTAGIDGFWTYTESVVNRAARYYRSALPQNPPKPSGLPKLRPTLGGTRTS